MTGRSTALTGGAAPPRSSFADVGGRVHLRTWEGPDDLTFVCVHAIGKDGRMWSPVAPLLAARGRVVAPDLPGHGRTEARTGAALDALADLVAEVATGAARERLVLVGESLGGAVAALAARACGPEALVLLSSYYPPWYGGPSAPMVILGLMLTRLGEAGWSLQRRLLGAGGHGASGSEEPAVRDRARVARTRLSLVAASVTPRRTRRRFGRVDCPVLVLHGELDHEVPAAWARRYAADQPRATSRTFPEVGHLGRVANPRWWVDDVLTWLDEVRGSGTASEARTAGPRGYPPR